MDFQFLLIASCRAVNWLLGLMALMAPLLRKAKSCSATVLRAIGSGSANRENKHNTASASGYSQHLNSYCIAAHDLVLPTCVAFASRCLTFKSVHLQF